MDELPKELNEYMTNLLMRSKDAMDLSMWTEAVDDAKVASELGVDSDEEYRDYHYIDHFVEDLVDDIFGVQLTENEENDLKRYMFRARDEFDFGNLVSFRPAILNWIKSKKPHKKEAYPNIGLKWTKIPPNNEIAWAQLAIQVRKAYLKSGDEKGALIQVASMLEPPEDLEFAAWYKFKFGNDKKLYDLNKEIMRDSEGNMSIKPNKKRRTRFAGMYDSDNRYYLPKFNQPYMVNEEMESPMQPFSAEQELKSYEDKEKLESARSKLVSRTFAIDKLLEKYRDVISDAQLNDIEDALNALRKKVRNLRLASTINDTVVKTAVQMGNKGFLTGQLALLKAAEEFSGNPSYLIKEAIDGLAPMVTELQRIDQSLKRRDLAREIARVDFQLHDMQLSGLFPELSDAQSRLIEAYTYASNKIKEIIPKMRSTQPGAAGQSEVISPNEMSAPALPPTGPAPAARPEPTPASVQELEKEIARE